MEVAVIILGGLLGVREWLHHKERQELLNRIQAPERVVLEQTPRESKLEDGPGEITPWTVPEADRYL